MKQIYYTQCPIGYGLGASNGFQIKRLSPGYPVSGDFRHFSLRAFVAGTRAMAPATLRYRRGEGDVAEVAWLTPRSHEYETERGPWGRPGGHFAHGVQLDDAELRALGDWPAGLYDQPFWARADPEPSRGQPPASLELSPADLRRPPTFAAIAPLAEGEDFDRLARLLTALATAAREGRTLFLIDEPQRLAERVSLLTFAFPVPWRAALTFSTYHDRPEELPGFRLQGTTSSARPNRAALLAHGFVADLVGSASGTIEPRVEPAGWARTLAGWLVRHGADDQADWEATRRRALQSRPPADPESIWSESWLERMFGLPRMLREPPPVPGNAREWTDLADWTAWVGRAGLADEWIRTRPPAWWRSAADRAEGSEARTALLRQFGLPDAWRGNGQASDWGEVVALWVRSYPDEVRLATTARALTAAPDAERPSCAGALIRGLPADAAAATVGWLEAQPAWDRSILLPLKAPGTVAAAVESRDPAALRAVLAEAMALPDVLPAVLDALAAGARDLAGALPVVAGHLAEALEGAPAGAVNEVHRWALNPSRTAAAWLGPFWIRLFADPLNLDVWRRLVQQTPQALQGALIPVVLGIALEPHATIEAFRWGIEDLVLPLPEPQRPHDPSWPGAYLDRLPSGLDLLKRLFSKEYRRQGIRPWLEQARERGELSHAQAARLDDCVRYARVLLSGDARALLKVRLPDVPAEERGKLLGQILGRLGDASDDSLNLALDTARAAWPGGFDPGALGLDGLAQAMAEPLLAERTYPDLWIERLERVLERLGLTAAPGGGFEPDGLAAELVAVTVRRAGAVFDPWQLRQALLRHDLAWKALAADIRRDLDGRPVEEGRTILKQWDHKLDKRGHSGRFYELWFNVCDAPQLVAAVADRTGDTKNFDLPWWESNRYPGARNDVRERLARQAPLAPLENDVPTKLRSWLKRPRPPSARSTQGGLVPIEGDDPRRQIEDWIISNQGQTRWNFIEELTIFSQEGSLHAHLARVKGWYRSLPLDQLAICDRYQFLASVIRLLGESDPVLVDCLAKWLHKCGVTDRAAIKDWDQKLAGLDPVPSDLVLARAGLVRALCDELKTIGREAKEGGRKTGSTGSP